MLNLLRTYSYKAMGFFSIILPMETKLKKFHYFFTKNNKFSLISFVYHNQCCQILQPYPESCDSSVLLEDQHSGGFKLVSFPLILYFTMAT